MSKRIPVEHLRECLEYNPDTGILTWRRRPRDHFETDWGFRVSNSRFAGKVAGWSSRNDYSDVRITHQGKHILVKAHRVCWALWHGEWPSSLIDHVNGIRSDNRLVNLRACTRSQNMENLRGAHRRNKCGLIGVYFDKRSGMWVSSIQANGKKHWVGSFGTAEEAHQAYLAAKARLHTFNPVQRSA